MNKVDYYFKLRDAREVASQLQNINKGLEYKYLDKKKALSCYSIGIGAEYNLNDLFEKVEQIHQQNFIMINQKGDCLNKKWQEHKDEYFKYLEEVLGVEFQSIQAINCCPYLHILPINEIDFKGNTIYLDCNRDEVDIFRTFIVMLTKLIVLKVWQNKVKWDFDTKYDAQNKVWLFAEIAIDAIFCNSKLTKFCSRPSYKYFYSIKIDGVNIMEEFRKLFGKIELLDFLDIVYIFVDKNYKSILKFKNYLY